MGFMETPRWPPVARTGRTIRAVARLAKLSGFGTLGAVEAHHARTRPTLNADPAQLARNEWLIRAEGGLVDAVRTRIEQTEKMRQEAWEAAMAAWTAEGGKGTAGPKPRKPQPRRPDAVLAVEVVLSVSPEFFRPERPWEAGTYDPERLAAWRDASMAWLRGRYGDNLVSAVLHLDEATPHIQAVFVPLTADHRLSAKVVVGGPDELRRFQDSVGEAMAPLGIQRGMEGSIAVHRDVDEYYALVNRPREPEPLQVTIGTPPLVGRREWAAEQVERIKAQVDAVVQEAEARSGLAELEREKARKLPAIVAGVRTDAKAAVSEAETQAATRVKEAEREAKDAWQAAEEARLQADMALGAARSAADALKAERQAQAAVVRRMPLETVLEAAGWEQDAEDLRYWHGPGSRVRVDGPGSCWDEERGRGAKNAIDLAKLLTGRSYEDAVAWLGEAVGRQEAQAAARAAAEDLAEEPPEPFEPPAPTPDAWPVRRELLVAKRRLPERVVDGFKQAGLLIARPRGFLLAMRDVAGAVVGAERYDDEGRLSGLFRRSRRDRGGVRLARGQPGQPRDVFLAESGLDALSLHELVRPDPAREQVFVSTAGARSRVPWLRGLLTRGARLFVAYGPEPASEGAAAAILAQYPRMAVRWVPKGADWNEHLVARKEAERTSGDAGAHLPEDDEGWEPPGNEGSGP